MFGEYHLRMGREEMRYFWLPEAFMGLQDILYSVFVIMKMLGYLIWLIFLY